MPPLIRYNLPQLARTYLNLRQIALIADIVEMITGAYVHVIREKYIEQKIDAQLIFMASNSMEILVKNTLVFSDFSFFEILFQTCIHESWCREIYGRIHMFDCGNSFEIQVIACSCNGGLLKFECNTGWIIPYNQVHEILRIVYDNSLELKLYAGYDIDLQIFY